MTLKWKGTYAAANIKCPFDCLWHHYTRKFEVTTNLSNKLDTIYYMYEGKPKDFDNW